MKKRISVTIGLIALVLLLSFARFKGVGTGLRVVAESVPCNSPGCFEGLSHYNYLYDSSAKISRVGETSISPSGLYAVFSNGDGQVMLYKKGSRNLKDVTDGRDGIPQTFVWDEAHSKVIITLCQNHRCPPLIIHLDS